MNLQEKYEWLFKRAGYLNEAFLLWLVDRGCGHRLPICLDERGAGCGRHLFGAGHGRLGLVRLAVYAWAVAGVGR